MAREAVLGNGNIFVGFDDSGYLREFYFPYVGLENHIAAHNQHRLGVFVDNTFSWLHEKDWTTTVDCLDDTMASQTTRHNAKLQLNIKTTDIVYNEKNVLLRTLSIQNLAKKEREVRFFFGQEFELYESKRGDTAYYDKRDNTVIHYKGKRVFLINALVDGQPFTEYTTGIFNIYGKEGSFRDAEDGFLQKNSIEHGPCDSVIGTVSTIQAGESSLVEYWLCAAESIEEAKELNTYVLNKKPSHLLKTTTDYWRAWLHRYTFTFHGLSDIHKKLFHQSLLIIKAHTDKRGSIIASGDTSMLQSGKDTYSYMWPRDAAFAALALHQTGDQGAAQKLFQFCNRVIEKEGYLMHKYLPDGSLGSSWHPWVRDGKVVLPIQEDETALILFALGKYYEEDHDLEFIESIYNSFIQKSANFLITYRDEDTNLPHPSYDLWEEKFGIHTFTVASVFGALNAAAKFAKILGKTDDQERFSLAAETTQKALMDNLYDKERQVFRKSITPKTDGFIHDDTIDASSAYGVYMFEVLSIDDANLEQAIKNTINALTLPGPIGGMARYHGDTYFKQSNTTIGNPWFITSLWYGQYWSDKAKNEQDLTKAKKILSWAAKHAGASGVLAEQLDEKTGKLLSSTPLTWSHVEYVRTILSYLRAVERLGICKTCHTNKTPSRS
jgi:oligosaccharide amylase